MIVRLTYFNSLTGKIDELKKFHNEVATPTVKKQKGNIDCKLLEPVNSSDQFISMTTWESQEDADAYQSKGVYKQLVDEAKKLFSNEPALKVYRTEGVMEHA
jgi:quinol monooxygenase YgiN